MKHAYTNSEEILGRKIIGSLGTAKVIFRFSTSKVKNVNSATLFCTDLFGSDLYEGIFVKSKKRTYAECDIKMNDLFENIQKHFFDLNEIKAKDIYCKVYSDNGVIFISYNNGQLSQQDSSIEAIDSLVNVGTARYRIEQQLEGGDYLYIRFKPRNDTFLYNFDRIARNYVNCNDDSNFNALSDFMNKSCKKNKQFSYVDSWDFPCYNESGKKFQAPLSFAKNLCFLEMQYNHLIIAFRAKDVETYLSCSSQKKDSDISNMLFFFNVISKEMNAYMVQKNKTISDCGWFGDGDHLHEFSSSVQCTEYN